VTTRESPCGRLKETVPAVASALVMVGATSASKIVIFAAWPLPTRFCGKGLFPTDVGETDRISFLMMIGI
jgi:hypothetical protein